MLPVTAEDQQLAAITLSHRSTPVAVRERLVDPQHDWGELLHGAVPGLQEWLLLSTCHRFELYVVASNGRTVEQALRSLLATVVHDAGANEFATTHDVEAYFSVRQGMDAAHHLCRVTIGLDSAVLGEPQIQGQVAQAYTGAVEQGTIGPVLSAVFRTALRSGKRARHETTISTRAANLSSVALNLALQWVGGLETTRVVVIGAGEMSRLALKALHARKARHVVVVNRTCEKARAALLDPHWRAAPLTDLDNLLDEADIVFSATRAEGHLLSAERVARLLDFRRSSGRTHGPALIDLAVPRDIDPNVRSLPNLLLVDVDDLHTVLDQNRQARLEALPDVEAIVDDELRRLETELCELSVRPVVVELRRQAEQIRLSEVERTLRFLGPVDEDTRSHLHHMSRALVNKLLHAPTTRIKQLAQSTDAVKVADTVRALFALDHTAESCGHRPDASRPE